MRIDLHNHTPLCNHASGTPFEFAMRAKELGIDVYGFACHAPMAFDEAYRMKSEELPTYLEMIHSLKESMQEEFNIEILCGLEVDFIKGRKDLLASSVLQADVDYLIGSVHFLDTWGFDNPEFIGEYQKRDMYQCWSLYLESLREMAESRVFQIVGHLDLLKLFGYTMPQALETQLQQTLESILKAQMSIEINAAGLRKQIQEIYPSKQILSKAFALGIPITFGCDAHSLEQVGVGYEQCLEAAMEVGYTECVFYRKKQQVVAMLDS